MGLQEKLLCRIANWHSFPYMTHQQTIAGNAKEKNTILVYPEARLFTISQYSVTSSPSLL